MSDEQEIQAQENAAWDAHEATAIYDEGIAEVHALVDHWKNQAAGLGTPDDDRSLSTFLCARGFLPQTTLEEFYKQNPIAKRIVNRPSNDATRVPFKVEDLDAHIDVNELDSDMESLGIQTWMNLGMKWKRLYGGALGIIHVNDGGGFEHPIDMKKFTKIRALHVVDRFHANPRSIKFKLNKTGFLVPEQYVVTMPNGKTKTVHKSRTVRFDGVPLPPDLLAQNEYWGLSELEAPYDDIRRLYVTRQYLENFVHEASIAVLKIEGLKKMLTASRPDGKDPKKAVAEALQNLRRQATNFHWIGLDANDSYEMHSKASGGLENVEKHFVDAVVMSDDIPRSILLGETPGGLNTGENAGEIRSYYDWISVMQTQDLTPIVTRVLELHFQAAHNRATIANLTRAPDEEQIDYPIPEDFTIGWESLWQQTESDEIAQASTESTVDKAYIDMGAITVAEVRRLRFVEGKRGPLQLTEEEAAESRAGTSVAVATYMSETVTAVATGLLPAPSAIQLIMLAEPSMSLAQATAIVEPAESMGEVAAQMAAELEVPQSEIDPTMEAEGLPESQPFDDMPTDLMSAAQIGVQLGVTAATIRAMGKRNTVRFWKVGSQLRYSFSEVVEASDPGGEFQVAPNIPPPIVDEESPDPLEVPEGHEEPPIIPEGTEPVGSVVEGDEMMPPALDS